MEDRKQGDLKFRVERYIWRDGNPGCWDYQGTDSERIITAEELLRDHEENIRLKRSLITKIKEWFKAEEESRPS